MPTLTPKVPEGLTDLMKGLAKEVLREKPDNIYKFAAQHFEKLLLQRDGRLDKGYEQFTAFEKYMKGRERYAIPPDIHLKCARAAPVGDVGEKASTSQEVGDDNTFVTDDNKKDMKNVSALAKTNLANNQEYMRAIYVIQRFFRRTLKAKRAATRMIASDEPHTSKTIPEINQQYMKAIYVIQRFVRRTLKAKRAKQVSAATTVTASAISQQSQINLEPNQQYLKSIYVIQRFVRRSLKAKQSMQVSAPPIQTNTNTPSLTKEAAAVIIQRTMRKLFTEKSQKTSTTPTEEFEEHSKVTLDSLDVLQDDNISETASYTSSSTIQMLADVSEVRDDSKGYNNERQIIYSKDTAMNFSAENGGNTVIESESTENNAYKVEENIAIEKLNKSLQPPDQTTDANTSDVTSTATLTTDSTAAISTGSTKPSKENDTSTAIVNIGKISSDSNIGINSSKNSNTNNNKIDSSQSRAENAEVERTKTASGNDKSSSSKPHVDDVAAVVPRLSSANLNQKQIEKLDSLDSRPNTLETFSVQLNETPDVENFAEVPVGCIAQRTVPNNIIKLDPDTGEVTASSAVAYQMYEVYYQDKDDPEFSDSLNECTMEKDSLENVGSRETEFDDHDADSIDESMEVYKEVPVVLKIKPLDEAPSVGDDNQLECRQKSAESDRTTTYVYGIHKSRLISTTQKGHGSQKSSTAFIVPFDDNLKVSLNVAERPLSTTRKALTLPNKSHTAENPSEVKLKEHVISFRCSSDVSTSNSEDCEQLDSQTSSKKVELATSTLKAVDQSLEISSDENKDLKFSGKEVGGESSLCKPGKESNVDLENKNLINIKEFYHGSALTEEAAIKSKRMKAFQDLPEDKTTNVLSTDLDSIRVLEGFESNKEIEKESSIHDEGKSVEHPIQSSDQLISELNIKGMLEKNKVMKGLVSADVSSEEPQNNVAVEKFNSQDNVLNIEEPNVRSTDRHRNVFPASLKLNQTTADQEDTVDNADAVNDQDFQRVISFEEGTKVDKSKENETVQKNLKESTDDLKDEKIQEFKKMENFSLNEKVGGLGSFEKDQQVNEIEKFQMCERLHETKDKKNFNRKADHTIQEVKVQDLQKSAEHVNIIQQNIEVLADQLLGKDHRLLQNDTTAPVVKDRVNEEGRITNNDIIEIPSNQLESQEVQHVEENAGKTREVQEIQNVTQFKEDLHSLALQTTKEGSDFKVTNDLKNIESPGNYKNQKKGSQIYRNNQKGDELKKALPHSKHSQAEENHNFVEQNNIESYKVKRTQEMQGDQVKRIEEEHDSEETQICRKYGKVGENREHQFVNNCNLLHDHKNETPDKVEKSLTALLKFYSEYSEKVDHLQDLEKFKDPQYGKKENTDMQDPEIPVTTEYKDENVKNVSRYQILDKSNTKYIEKPQEVFEISDTNLKSNSLKQETTTNSAEKVILHLTQKKKEDILEKESISKIRILESGSKLNAINVGITELPIDLNGQIQYEENSPRQSTTSDTIIEEPSDTYALFDDSLVTILESNQSIASEDIFRIQDSSQSQGNHNNVEEVQLKRLNKVNDVKEPFDRFKFESLSSSDSDITANWNCSKEADENSFSDDYVTEGGAEREETALKRKVFAKKYEKEVEKLSENTNNFSDFKSVSRPQDSQASDGKTIYVIKENVILTPDISTNMLGAEAETNYVEDEGSIKKTDIKSSETFQITKSNDKKMIGNDGDANGLNEVLKKYKENLMLRPVKQKTDEMLDNMSDDNSFKGVLSNKELIDKDVLITIAQEKENGLQVFLRNAKKEYKMEIKKEANDLLDSCEIDPDNWDCKERSDEIILSKKTSAGNVGNLNISKNDIQNDGNKKIPNSDEEFTKSQSKTDTCTILETKHTTFSEVQWNNNNDIAISANKSENQNSENITNKYKSENKNDFGNVSEMETSEIESGHVELKKEPTNDIDGAFEKICDNGMDLMFFEETIQYLKQATEELIACAPPPPSDGPLLQQSQEDHTDEHSDKVKNKALSIEHYDTPSNQAATTIQKVYRGHLVRRFKAKLIAGTSIIEPSANESRDLEIGNSPIKQVSSNKPDEMIAEHITCGKAEDFSHVKYIDRSIEINKEEVEYDQSNKKLLDQAATTIQRVYRGYLFRRENPLNFTGELDVDKSEIGFKEQTKEYLSGADKCSDLHRNSSLADDVSSENIDQALCIEPRSGDTVSDLIKIPHIRQDLRNHQKETTHDDDCEKPPDDPAYKTKPKEDHEVQKHADKSDLNSMIQLNPLKEVHIENNSYNDRNIAGIEKMENPKEVEGLVRSGKSFFCEEPSAPFFDDETFNKLSADLEETVNQNRKHNWFVGNEPIVATSKSSLYESATKCGTIYSPTLPEVTSFLENEEPFVEILDLTNDLLTPKAVVKSQVVVDSRTSRSNDNMSSLTSDARNGLDSNEYKKQNQTVIITTTTNPPPSPPPNTNSTRATTTEKLVSTSSLFEDHKNKLNNNLANTSSDKTVSAIRSDEDIKAKEVKEEDVMRDGNIVKDKVVDKQQTVLQPIDHEGDSTQKTENKLEIPKETEDAGKTSYFDDNCNKTNVEELHIDSDAHQIQESSTESKSFLSLTEKVEDSSCKNVTEKISSQIEDDCLSQEDLKNKQISLSLTDREEKSAGNEENPMEIKKATVLEIFQNSDMLDNAKGDVVGISNDSEQKCISFDKKFENGNTGGKDEIQAENKDTTDGKMLAKAYLGNEHLTLIKDSDKSSDTNKDQGTEITESTTENCKLKSIPDKLKTEEEKFESRNLMESNDVNDGCNSRSLLRIQDLEKNYRTQVEAKNEEFQGTEFYTTENDSKNDIKVSFNDDNSLGYSEDLQHEDNNNEIEFLGEAETPQLKDKDKSIEVKISENKAPCREKASPETSSENVLKSQDKLQADLKYTDHSKDEVNLVAKYENIGTENIDVTFTDPIDLVINAAEESNSTAYNDNASNDKRGVKKSDISSLTKAGENQSHYEESIPTKEEDNHATAENIKILSDFIHSKEMDNESDIPYEVLEEACVKKTISLTHLASLSTDTEVDETDSSSTPSDITKPDIDLAETSSIRFDTTTLDIPDSLDAMTGKLRENEKMLERMQQRRASETKINSSAEGPDRPMEEQVSSQVFVEPVIKPMQELEVITSTKVEDEEIVIISPSTLGDTTTESSTKSDSIVFGDGYIDSDMDGVHIITPSIQRLHTIAVMDESKVLFKSVTIDENIKYIDPSEYGTTTSGSSFCLDDDTSENIRQKMMACSLSEADSDCFESEAGAGLSGEYSKVAHDDFNIQTALGELTGTSTETESTIISAATKIQAGARGFLTRRRLRRASVDMTKSYAQDNNSTEKASFGNDAIGESLERLIEEEAARKIQKAYRRFYRQMGVNSSPSVCKHLSDQQGESTLLVHNTAGAIQNATIDLTTTSDDGVSNGRQRQTRARTTEERASANKRQRHTVSDDIDEETHILSSFEGTLAARRLQLQRGDAMRNDSAPDEENANNCGTAGCAGVGGKHMDPAKSVPKSEALATSTLDLLINKAATSTVSSTTITTTTTATARDWRKHAAPSDAEKSPRPSTTITKKINKMKWFTLRQNSMPVQIDSEVFRVIPKHMRKRIRSAEDEKKKRLHTPRD